MAPPESAQHVGVHVRPAARSTPRQAVYTHQLRSRFQSNDASWQETIATIQSFDRSRKLAEEQKLWETFMLILAVIGILCVSVEGELLGDELAQLVEERREFSSADPLAYSIPFIVLKGVLSGTSGLLVYALVMRYRIVCKIKTMAKQLPPDATFFSAYSGLRSQFLLEVLVCLAHMPLLSADRQIWRWGEYDVLCLDQLDVVVFTRIYLLGRVLRNHFGLNSLSHEARLISSMNQIDLSSIWLTVKFSFQKFPVESALTLLGIDWFSTSAALNFFERCVANFDYFMKSFCKPFVRALFTPIRASNPTETNASDAFWLTIVTITGVGYGDTFPWTLGGKIVVAIGGIIGGMVIACLLRVVLIDALQLSPREQTVLDVARFYRYVRQRKESAAVLVQQAWKWHRAKSTSKRRARSQKTRLYAAADAFRLLRFAQPPSLAGDSYASSSLSAASMTDVVAKRTERLRERIDDRRRRSCSQLKQTANLLRSVADSSQSPATQSMMLGRAAPLVLRRCLSTSAGPRRAKGLNLTPYVSPLLLRLHPDTVQRQAPALAQENEQALKHLNVFLELATLGCNNDAFNARKQVLALSESRQSIEDQPLRFPLVFHVPADDLDAQSRVDGFVEVKYTVEVPGRLVKRTLSNPGRSVSARTDPEAALQAPFAREWQRTTRRILQDLFALAQVPLVVEEEGEVTKRTALAEWLEEEDTVADQADMHGIRVGEKNKAKKREHEQFDKIFHAMLTREKNIVQETTTGLEDGPTTQHAVLTSLLRSRLFLPKFQDPHMKKSAFHWIANFLLVNFMELRLHSLVWNKITLLITADADVEEPQVSWDEEAPEQGMGILIPIGMDYDALTDFIYEHVEDLEFALDEKSTRAQTAAKMEQQRLRREKKKKRQKRQGHFYQDEVNAIFRKN